MRGVVSQLGPKGQVREVKGKEEVDKGTAAGKLRDREGAEV